MCKKRTKIRKKKTKSKEKTMKKEDEKDYKIKKEWIFFRPFSKNDEKYKESI